MNFQEILVNTDKGVTTITLNRPDKLNAWTPTMGNEVKSAMEGMLEPTEEENIIGNVEVREIYKISKVGTIAGCYVTNGNIIRKPSLKVFAL